MKKKNRRNRKSKKNTGWLVVLAGAAAVLCGIVFVVPIFMGRTAFRTPEELLVEYINHISEGEFEEMYAMLDVEASGNISRESFVERNSRIYEGIGIENIQIDILEQSDEEETVKYEMAFDTCAGAVSFENEAHFIKGEDGYGLVWEDSLIFPELEADDKVRVSTTQAVRGEIFDRNGQILAGQGIASSVGIVPGKLEDRQAAVEEIAALLDMDTQTIEKKLSASWVTEDSFVPVKTIPKVKEIDLMTLEPDEGVLQEKQRQDNLLAIPGIMISDVTVREYPLGEAAAHLIGYVQNVTAEDLEKHAGEGYSSGSVIGRSGMEALFEKELKGQDGCKIYIEDAEGNLKSELAVQAVQNGADIKLTIDASLQSMLYEQFQEDKGCSAALNPYTGEVLALVSTPSYDTNDFILGMSDARWTELNDDEGQPLYNRFRQTWCPGSTFKPVIAAIGLESGNIDPLEDYGNEGLSWQKDSSWGSYYVTTLHTYEPVILENALIYSDNIYFAKAALNIGSEELEQSLSGLGFCEQFPFEITMSVSQYSNTEHIDTEIQLADSGYGQGQILVNPLHLASIYTAFSNEGNVIRPYLVYKEEPETDIWIPGAFSGEVSEQVLSALKKVVNDPNGTGYAAHMDSVTLAGKTGTAEIKDSKEDSSGTELGWFAVFTPEQDTSRPILIVSMTEDVKDIGGSGYVVKKVRNVLEEYFSQ